MAKIDNLKSKIQGALGDPQAPWYGSDLVSWVGDYIEEVEWLQDKLKAKSERIKELKGIEELLDEIEAVSCGEKQIECDGVYDDSDGLAWIYKRIQALKPHT